MEAFRIPAAALMVSKTAADNLALTVEDQAKALGDSTLPPVYVLERGDLYYAVPYRENLARALIWKNHTKTHHIPVRKIRDRGLSLADELGQAAERLAPKVIKGGEKSGDHISPGKPWPKIAPPEDMEPDFSREVEGDIRALKHSGQFEKLYAYEKTKKRKARLTEEAFEADLRNRRERDWWSWWRAMKSWSISPEELEWIGRKNLKGHGFKVTEGTREDKPSE
jgi:hypothetical protein